MKRIITALGNESITEKIKKTGKYELHCKDISYQEGVLQYLAQNNADIIVTKDSLSGEMTKEIYLKQIRLIKPQIKIVLFVSKLTPEYKGFLFSNEIFNIIESEVISFIEIIEMIETQGKQVVYKNTNEVHIEKNMPIRVTTKKMISVYGTSGAGKSYVSSVISQIISKKFKLNTLLIDMDIQNSAIDIYNNINAGIASLYNVMEEMDNNTFTSNILDSNIVKAKRNRNLSFLTNNIGVYESQNKLSPAHYSRLYKEAKNRYDITVIDLPSSPFLDVVPYSLMRSNYIFFVVSPNFISIRQAVKHLELMTNVWDISKEKIHVIVNRTKKESLGNRQIETLLKDFKVCFTIEEKPEVEMVINGLQELEVEDFKDINVLGQTIGLEDLEQRKPYLHSKVQKLIGVNQ